MTTMRTPEQLAATTRKRSVSMKAAMARRTPEQKSASEYQQANSLKKYHASRTPEQRAERAAKHKATCAAKREAKSQLTAE